MGAGPLFTRRTRFSFMLGVSNRYEMAGISEEDGGGNEEG